jgi:hypothetical protein
MRMIVPAATGGQPTAVGALIGEGLGLEQPSTALTATRADKPLGPTPLDWQLVGKHFPSSARGEMLPSSAASWRTSIRHPIGARRSGWRRASVSAGRQYGDGNKHFAESGVEGVLRDKTRKPGKAPIAAETTAWMVALT